MSQPVSDPVPHQGWIKCVGNQGPMLILSHSEYSLFLIKLDFIRVLTIYPLPGSIAPAPDIHFQTMQGSQFCIGIRVMKVLWNLDIHGPGAVIRMVITGMHLLNLFLTSINMEIYCRKSLW